MLDYKRFISYLYSYIEGEKGVNVGYIRCEQRQGICRLTLNVQDRHGIEEGDYKVYLYKMTEEGIPIGYYLDELRMKGFCGDLRKQTSAQNVWNTGNRIEDFDGIIAIYDKNHMYVSQWTDEIVHAYRFITIQDFNIKSRSKSEQAEKLENLSLEDSSPQDLMISDSNDEDLTSSDSDDGNWPYEVSTEDANRFAAEMSASEEQTNLPTISKLTIRLMENRPKLPDFENHEIYDCVRIEPNDIGLLEMENWRLGVNSFLTHGFYNYKYLMLGKLRFQDGVVKAVLGVPGIFDNKEQYIAKIFGFEVFIPVKHTNTKTGNFGYWIVELT